MDILVVLENNNGAIHRMSLEAIVAAQKLADEQKQPKLPVLFVSSFSSPYAPCLPQP